MKVGRPSKPTTENKPGTLKVGVPGKTYNASEWYCKYGCERSLAGTHAYNCEYWRREGKDNTPF